MVHTYMDGSLGAVLGFMFDRFHYDMEDGHEDHADGEHDNWFLDQISGVLEPGAPETMYSKVSLDNFLREVDIEDYWSYDGSLTTPPCTEGIKWTVFEQVQPMSQRQFDKFNNLWAGDYNYAHGKGNNRHVNGLLARTLVVTD